VQVDPFTFASFEQQRKGHAAEWKPVTGAGEAAYERVNATSGNLDLVARAGQRVVTILIDTDVPPTATVDKARAAAIGLTQALFAKLR
jgi:hypothetical protein